MSNVLIGVTGCIAAYKAAALVREFIKNDFEVKVIMTENASKFITALTMRTLSGNKVYTDLFDDENEYSTEHIALSEWADILVVAPASADIIGKFACGIADDLLSTEYLSFNKHVLIAPTMNERMYLHPATRRNLTILKERGVVVIEPEKGFLACGDEGKGRLPDVETILMHAKRLLREKDLLKGKRVVITGGGTSSKIDPVRVITNLSTGAMADAFISQAFYLKAEKITYIHGRINVRQNPVSKNIYAESSHEMLKVLREEIEKADLLVMAAAVNDFKTNYSEEKIKKNKFSLKLSRDIDILNEIKNIKTKAVKVGFALESSELEKNGLKKLREKHLDYIVVNSPSNIGSNKCSARVLSKSNKTLTLKNISKEEIAGRVLEWIKI
ncbi:MAG: bifunctional phosphopantothenoylcysteine decarboxylase/phosphopantothenate--cysteine ligase CoaBC [bacterium]